MTALPQHRFATESFERQLLVKRLNLPKIFGAIDADPAITGAGLVYIDSSSRVTQLRPFRSSCHSKPVYIILKEPPRDMDITVYARDLRTNTRESQLTGEILGAGLSCAGAVLGWMVVITSTAMLPVTGGLTTAVTVVGYAAAIASAGQCLTGVVRVGLEIGSPDLKDDLVSQEWFNTTSTALDVISLAGVSAAGFSTIRMVLTLKATTGKSIREVLKGLNRQERARVSEELARLNYPGASNAMIKQMRRTGQIPKRYSNEQIRKDTLTHIKDAAGSLFAITGSATSGVLKALAIGVYEEIDP